MQTSDETLQFFQCSELQHVPTIPPASSLSSDVIVCLGSLSPESPSSTEFSTPASTSAISIHVDDEGAKSPHAQPYPVPIFDILKLLANPPTLSPNLSDVDTVHVLSSILADVNGGLYLEPSRVDSLVAHCEGRFACPFVGCLKKHGGWVCIRNARDHIWIDHFFRRFPCPWEGCAVTFGRQHEQNTHVQRKHLGTGEMFPCSECGVTFPKMFNVNRHYRTAHETPVPQVQRSVNRLGHANA